VLQCITFFDAWRESFCGCSQDEVSEDPLGLLQLAPPPPMTPSPSSATPPPPGVQADHAPVAASSIPEPFTTEEPTASDGEIRVSSVMPREHATAPERAVEGVSADGVSTAPDGDLAAADLTEPDPAKAALAGPAPGSNSEDGRNASEPLLLDGGGSGNDGTDMFVGTADDWVLARGSVGLFGVGSPESGRVDAPPAVRSTLDVFMLLTHIT
jgi:hypothetical protein